MRKGISYFCEAACRRGSQAVDRVKNPTFQPEGRGQEGFNVVRLE